jgi:hypothetical protein
MSTITLPGFMLLHHLGGDQLGRRLARDQRGGDDDVGVLGLLRVHRALRGLEAFAHDLGVTAAARAFFLVVDLDEFAAQRLDLVGHLGARVVGAHDGAQVGRRADGGQAGHAGTGDEDLGRRHLARGRDLAVEEAAEGVGRLDHGAVAADAGHGRQRVHLLRAAQLARQAVDGQHGGLARGQLLHQLGVLRRPDEADQRAAFAHQRHFVGRGTRTLKTMSDRPQMSAAEGTTSAPGGAVGVVGKVGGVTGAAFHGDREPQLDELFHHVGHGGDALFAAAVSFGTPISMAISSAWLLVCGPWPWPLRRRAYTSSERSPCAGHGDNAGHEHPALDPERHGGRDHRVGRSLPACRGANPRRPAPEQPGRPPGTGRIPAAGRGARGAGRDRPRLRPHALVGVYLARFQRPARDADITYLRFAYSGTVGDELPGRTLDTGIVRTLWLTLDEVRASTARHRSPLVLRASRTTPPAVDTGWTRWSRDPSVAAPRLTCCRAPFRG